MKKMFYMLMLILLCMMTNYNSLGKSNKKNFKNSISIRGMLRAYWEEN